MAGCWRGGADGNGVESKTLHVSRYSSGKFLRRNYVPIEMSVSRKWMELWQGAQSFLVAPIVVLYPWREVEKWVTGASITRSLFPMGFSSLWKRCTGGTERHNVPRQVAIDYFHPAIWPAGPATPPRQIFYPRSKDDQRERFVP